MKPLAFSEAFLRSVELKTDGLPVTRGYPFNIPAVQKLGSLSLHPAVTFLVGENGSGKSTLVEAIASCAGFNPEGGSKNFNFAMRPSESSLANYLRLVRGIRREKVGFFLRGETMFNVASAAESLGLPWASLHEMSHGESFLWVALNRFKEHGLYILDEPESALSPQRQLALLVRIHDLMRSGSQFIISTHSPILLAYPQAVIYELDTNGISPTRFEDTEHYLVTRSFLQDPAQSIKRLLADTDEGGEPE